MWDNLPCAGEEAVKSALRLDRRRDQLDLEIAISVAISKAARVLIDSTIINDYSCSKLDNIHIIMDKIICY